MFEHADLVATANRGPGTDALGVPAWVSSGRGAGEFDKRARTEAVQPHEAVRLEHVPQRQRGSDGPLSEERRSVATCPSIGRNVDEPRSTDIVLRQSMGCVDPQAAAHPFVAHRGPPTIRLGKLVRHPGQNGSTLETGDR